MRVTFIHSIRDLTYAHYRNKPMSMCEIKWNQIFSEILNLLIVQIEILPI